MSLNDFLDTNEKKWMSIGCENLTVYDNFNIPNLNPGNFYSTGTWPVTIGDGTNNFVTSTSTGQYTRIGNTYFCYVQIVWTSKGTASGGISINLPATSNTNRSARVAASFGFCTGLIYGTSTEFIMTNSGGSNFGSFYSNTNLGTNSIQMTDANFGTTGQIQLNFNFSV